MHDDLFDRFRSSKANFLTEWRPTEAANRTNPTMKQACARSGARFHRDLGSDRVAVGFRASKFYVEMMVAMTGIEKERVVILVAGIESA